MIGADGLSFGSGSDPARTTPFPPPWRCMFSPFFVGMVSVIQTPRATKATIYRPPRFDDAKALLPHLFNDGKTSNQLNIRSIYPRLYRTAVSQMYPLLPS